MHSLTHYSALSVILLLSYSLYLHTCLEIARRLLGWWGRNRVVVVCLPITPHVLVFAVRMHVPWLTSYHSLVCG
jgi:hypothetical protein